MKYLKVLTLQARQYYVQPVLVMGVVEGKEEFTKVSIIFFAIAFVGFSTMVPDWPAWRLSRELRQCGEREK